MNIALAIDNWVHRQTFQGSEQGTMIARMKAEWEKFKEKQSEVADDWQKNIGAIYQRLAEIDAHLHYTDKRIDDTPRPKNR